MGVSSSSWSESMSCDESESLSSLCGINHGLLTFICIHDKMVGRLGIMHIDGVVWVSRTYWHFVVSSTKSYEYITRNVMTFPSNMSRREILPLSLPLPFSLPLPLSLQAYIHNHRNTKEVYSCQGTHNNLFISSTLCVSDRALRASSLACGNSSLTCCASNWACCASDFAFCNSSLNFT